MIQLRRETKVLLTLLFLIALVTALYIFTDWFSKVTGYFTGEDKTEKLAKCLTEKGVEFYSSAACADCAEQEKILGKGLKKVQKIECGTDMENCPYLTKLPAWYIKGEIYYGVKDLSELAKLSGCPLEEK